MTQVSQKLVEFIKAMENFSATAYSPLKGDVLTIGYGFTTMPNGKAVQSNDSITENEAEKYLRNLLQKVFDLVENLGSGNTLNQLDAVTSLCYNVGFSAFHNSPSGGLFNLGKDLSNRFTMWNKFQGKPSKGLTARRLKERRIYLKGDYSPNLYESEKDELRSMGFQV